MNNNSSLYREPDFDDALMFYEVNGAFINGWKYEIGKNIASLSPFSGKQKTDSISPAARVSIQGNHTQIDFS